MIDLKSVTKIFYQKGKEIVALSDVSLRVPTGKIVGVIGTSGAGKSTLIRCVNLLEKPTSGDVLIEGRSLLRLTPIQLAKERRQIGMIFQHFNLLSSRTVYENVAFPLELDHTPTAKIRQRVMELLKLVGLEDRVNDYPATLSGGQKQRVAIARTLASRPKVLLCDEATSALDPSTTRSILNLLKDINRQFQITILLITHEMEVVKYICDEVAVIDQGKLVEKGTVAEIFTHPKTERTKAFVNSSLHIDIPETYLQRLQTSIGDRKNQLLRLTLTGQTINEPILSEAVRLFNVDTQIISAHMDHGGDVSFGVLLIELAGNQPQHQKVIQFFTDKHIQVDFLGYV